MERPSLVEIIIAISTLLAVSGVIAFVGLVIALLIKLFMFL